MLRNSLNAIDGHAELLAEREMDEEARQASIEGIRTQATSMHKIAETTDKIREIHEMTEDDRTWDRLDIESLVDVYQNQYSDAEITAVFDCDEAIHVRNVNLFEQALDEAVENAVKHGDQSPPAVTVLTDRDQDSEYVYISVADNGQGIPDHERDVIESGEETPLRPSLGIGLWMMEWGTDDARWRVDDFR